MTLSGFVFDLLLLCALCVLLGGCIVDPETSKEVCFIIGGTATIAFLIIAADFHKALKNSYFI